MSDVEKYAEQLIEFSNKIDNFRDELRNVFGGSSEWCINEFVASYLSVFDRFCPYKVDDRVQLSHTLDIEKSSGWYRSRHFLIQGSRGTVTDRGYRNDQFTFDVVFDDETWIDRDGNKQPVSKKHRYTIYEKQLLPCGDKGEDDE